MSPADNDRITRIVADTSAVVDPGERIASISSLFLATPYVSNSLIGKPDQQERLVTSLGGFDCFTFLDTVEALRRSYSPETYIGNLKAVRYKDGQIDYRMRRHFFSDWIADKDSLLLDATNKVGTHSAMHVDKILNQKLDKTLWLPGVPTKKRSITYISSTKVDAFVLKQLQQGDYVGIYSDKPGLDVSHTGIIIRQEGKVLFRHASSASAHMKVVDDDFLEYLQGKVGFVVYRAKPYE